jgi:hypothetical protein
LGEARNRRSTGWYAGAAAFWLLAAWLIAAGLSSIIPQIFWPSGEAAVEGSCESSLRALQRELLEYASASIAQAPSAHDQAKRESWLVDWDHRLALSRPSCTPREQKAWAELMRLRHGLEGLIERFERDEVPRLHKFEAFLSAGADPRAE